MKVAHDSVVTLACVLLVGIAGAAAAGDDLPAWLAGDQASVGDPATNSDVELGEDYGTDNDESTTIGWQAFLPRVSSTTYDSNGATGSRWLTGGFSSFVFAPLTIGDIPNGATISQIVFVIVDADASHDVNGYLCQYWTNSGTGGDPGGICPFDVSSSGTPGESEIYGNPNVTMRTRYDADQDGSYENVNWLLAVSLPSFSNGNAIHQVRLRWRRQISPAPGTATFADVPIGHPFFQHVEALADSGITAGCGGGNYCPDSPLTRGQMAVFLAKALGLHWDWSSGL